VLALATTVVRLIRALHARSSDARREPGFNWSGCAAATAGVSDGRATAGPVCCAHDGTGCGVQATGGSADRCRTTVPLQRRPCRMRVYESRAARTPRNHVSGAPSGGSDVHERPA
jgi:hypothetical protein